MELRNLKYFAAIAQTKSLTKASKQLHIAQPALSLSIKRLEEDLGVQLFDRRRRGMHLTRHGETFLVHADALIKQVNRARESVSSGDLENPQGTVNIGMVGSVVNAMIEPVFRITREKYPNIDVSVNESSITEIIQQLEIGHYDLVITPDVISRPSLGVVPLIEENLFLVGEHDKSILKNQEVEFSQLANHKILTPHKQHSVIKIIEDYAQKENIEIEASVVPVSLVGCLKLLSTEGVDVGLATLPWSAIYDHINQHRLTARKIVNPEVKRVIYMVYPINAPMTNAAFKMMEVIKSAVKEAIDQRFLARSFTA